MSKAPESSWFPRFASVAVESALVDTRIVVAEGACQVDKNVFEALAVAELRKQAGWCGARASMHHLRTKDQVEVDVVLTTRNGRVAAVEVKAGATVGSSDFRGLRWLQARTGASFSQGVVLYTGDEVLGFGPGLWALPFSALWS